MGVVFPLAARQLLIVAGGLESITMLRLWMAIVVILGIAAIATYTVFRGCPPVNQVMGKRILGGEPGRREARAGCQAVVTC